MLGMFLPLVMRRVLVYAPILLPVLLGTIVAVATTSSIVIYTQALRDVGLDHAINQADQRALDLRMNFESPGLDPDSYSAVVDRVRLEITRRLPDLVQEQIRHVRSDTFLISEQGQPPGDLSVAFRGSFHLLSDVNERFEIFGRFPEPQALVASDGSLMIEAVALEPGARFLGLELGDVLAFTPFWEDRTSVVNVRIVGIARVRDPEDPEWGSAALARLTSEPTLFNTLPVLVPGATLVDVLGTAFREMGGFHFWVYTTDTDRVQASNAEEIRRNIGFLGAALASSVPAYRQQTDLRNLLATYDTRLRFIQVPLAIMLLLVTAMVLYAVIFLATLVTQRQSADAALMRSRGARTSHVFYIYAAQGALIGGVATVVGPFLAAGFIAALGFLPAFVSLGNGGPLPVTLTPVVFLFGAIGGLLSFGVLLVPIFQIARRNPLEERRRTVRPPQASFVQRYYLDVGLAGAATLFLWQLGQQGSLVAGALSGERSTDLFLLLVPALFLVSAALLLLRLLPLAVRLLARVAAPSAPTWLALGLWQIGRNPLDATRLVLLLVLGAGLGAFAASFGGTLDRSYQERALYQAGAEVRFPSAAIARSGPSLDLSDLITNVEGVNDASLVLRQGGSFAMGPAGARFELLAIDPETFSEVSWWRDDFGRETLASVVDALRTEWPVPWGLPIPEDAQALGVWVRAVEPSTVSTLIALISDGNNRYFDVPLGVLESNEWTYMEAPLRPQPRGSFRRSLPTLEPVSPYTIRSLHVVQRSRSSGMTGGAFFLDSLMTRADVEGSPRPLHDFESNVGWDVLDVGALTRGDSMRVVPGGGRDGGDAILFTWSPISGFVQRGIYAGPEDYELPVVVSPSVLRGLGQAVGDSVVLSTGNGRVPVSIVGVVDYLPTLDPADGVGFILANLEDMVRQQNLIGQSSEVQPNEVWVTLEPGLESKAETLKNLVSITGSTRMFDREALLTTSKADPLVAAGWGALLLVAYGGVLFLGIVGFIAHAVLTVGERRVQFALLRTMGLGVAQIRAIVWFEHLLIVAAGIGAGYVLGLRTGALLMPFLDRTEEGIAVLPPFILETSWISLGAVFGIMAGAFILATAVVVRLYNRLALGQALRIGEE